MIAIALLTAIVLGSGATIDPEAQAHFDRMLASWAKVETLTYRFNKTERMRAGEVVVEEVMVKFKKPLLLYMSAILPRRGQELIYDPRRDPNRFVVHPGRFPDVTLHLDLRGSLATRGQHHVLTHASLGYTLGALERGLTRAKIADEGGVVQCLGETTLWGRRADRVRFEAGDVTPLEIAGRKGENLFAFAERVGADAYAIFDLNPEINSLTDELEAHRYRVPKSHGAKTEVVVDRETGLPIRLTVWDTAGRLYEQYDYMDMVVNPLLTDADFDPKNPAYNF